MSKRENKTVSRKLSVAEQNWQQLVNNLPDPVARFNRQCQFVYVNNVFLNNIEAEKMEDVIGKTNAGLGMPESINTPWLALMKKVFDTGEAGEMETYYPDGDDLRYMVTKVVPEFGEDGTVETVLAIGRDITERKTAERLLRNEHRQLKEAQLIGQVGSYTLDMLTGQYHWSDEMYRIHGMEAGETVTREKTVSLIAPEEKAHVLEKLAECSRQPCNTRIEHTIIRPNGEKRFVRHTMQSFADNAGNITHISGTVQDITEAKKAQDEILQLKDTLAANAENKYRLLFESIDEGFCIIQMIYDGEGRPVDWRYLEANPAFERQSGFSPVGKTETELRGGAEQPWLDFYQGILDTGKAAHIESPLPITDKWFSIYASPFGASGDMLTVIFNDITERKRNEERQAFLLKLSDALRQLRDPLDIQATAADLLGGVLKANQCHYGESDGESVHIHHSYANGLSPMKGKYRHDDFTDTIVDAFRTGQVQVCENTATAATISEKERAMMAAGHVGAFIAAPLVKEGKYVAVMTVHSIEPRKWESGEIELVQDAAERTWAAVERAKAEEALRKSEAQLAAILQTLPVGLGFFDMNARLSISNKAMQRYLPSGIMPSQDEQARNRWIAYDADGRLIDRNNYPSICALRGEPVPAMDMIYINDDGTESWTRVLSVPLRDDDGTITGAISVVSDIDELKTFSEALKQSQELLAKELSDTKILHQLSTRMIEEDNMQSVYEDILSAAMQLMHAEMASIQYFNQETHQLKLLAAKNFHPASVKHWEYVTAGASTGCGLAVAAMERVIIEDIGTQAGIDPADDEAFRLSGIVAVHSTPLVSRAGNLVGMISTQWKQPHRPPERELSLFDVLARQVADLIEKRQAEEALRLSEIKYRTLFEQMDEGFGICEIITDEKGRVTNWRWLEMNPAIEKLTGLTKETVTGKLMTEIFYELDMFWVKTYQKVMDTKESIRCEYYIPQLKRWLDCTVFPFGENKCGVLYDDVTARKSYEQQLRRFNISLEHQVEERNAELQQSKSQLSDNAEVIKRKDEFIGVASHELKTPLTAISIYAQLLLDKYGKNADHFLRSTVENLNHQVNRLTGLLTRLLDLTRVDTHKLAFRMHRFDLVDQLKETTELMQPTVKHRLIMNGADECMITGDSERINQVYLNLLTNAIKYAPGSDEVHIGITKSEHSVTVSVHDRGIGIAPEHLDKVFERYFRVRSKMQNFSGFGIGLYISAEIIAAHQGKIWAESDSEHGTVFYFTLPLHQ